LSRVPIDDRVALIYSNVLIFIVHQGVGRIIDAQGILKFQKFQDFPEPSFFLLAPPSEKIMNRYFVDNGIDGLKSAEAFS
jgi:hypothetical protein